jgi:hypothetical protein
VVILVVAVISILFGVFFMRRSVAGQKKEEM